MLGSVRPPWESLPCDVVARVADVLGSPVVAASSESGGFSPGVAARVRCADGRRAFVKAASADVNARTVAMHRREAVVNAALPDDVGAPALLGVVDEEPWVALVLEEVDGRLPALPWRPDELDAALALLDRLALVPAPAVLGQAADEDLSGWRQLASAGQPLTPFEDRHLAALVALEAQWPSASAGTGLLHLDVRADNLLLRPSGEAVLVDWPAAAAGAAVCDLVFATPSISLDGGPAPEAMLTRSAVARAADPDAVTVLVATVAGLLQHRRRQPPPPGLPTVRAFQAAQGDVALAWLAERTGWR